MTPSLESGFTLYQRGKRSNSIDYTYFADPDVHIGISDRQLADAIRNLAMKVADIKRFPVGGASENSVEFFVFDASSADTIRDIGDILRKFLIEKENIINNKLHENNGSFLDDGITGDLDACVDIIEIRRFVINATLRRSKKIKYILLFHHSAYNSALHE